MKAAVYERYGPPEVLHLKDVPMPVPKDDEVLIRVHAASVIAGDCEFRSFTFPLWFWLPLRLYAGLLRPVRVNVLGQDLSGEIEAVGKDVTAFKPGDQVFGATEIGLGAHAEYKCMSASKTLAIKPANVTHEQAAAVPTGGLNALHYLRRAEIRSGERVLVNGACGNIGTFAVQLAKHFGAEVTAVDRGDKLDTLSAIGADHVIDYTRQDFTRTGETYDVIFDVAGKSPYSRSVGVLRPNGRYLLANPRVAAMLRAPWTSRTSDKCVTFAFAKYRPDDLAFLASLMAAGRIRSVIDKRYPLDRIAEAHRYIDGGDKQGNVVVVMDGYDLSAAAA